MARAGTSEAVLDFSASDGHASDHASGFDSDLTDGRDGSAEALHDHDLHGQHMAVPHGGRGAGAGLIWFLVLLHLAFIGYWSYIGWKSRNAKAALKKDVVPQKVRLRPALSCPTSWLVTVPTRRWTSDALDASPAAAAAGQLRVRVCHAFNPAAVDAKERTVAHFSQVTSNKGSQGLFQSLNFNLSISSP